MHPFFDKSIEYLKGVGPPRADILRKELQIATYGNLLFHFPFRYVDRSRFYKVKEVTDDTTWVQIRGRITAFQSFGEKRTTRLVASLRDETGIVELVWFQGITWVKEMLRTGVEYVIFGKPSVFNGKINFVHPEIELYSETQQQQGFNTQPFYNTTEKARARGLDSKGILRLQKTLIQQLPPYLPESLPDSVISPFKMLSLGKHW